MKKYIKHDWLYLTTFLNSKQKKIIKISWTLKVVASFEILLGRQILLS